MNTQSWLWLVHSIQVFAWKGVHRRNMPPTVAPGAPEPVKFQPPPPQDPVRSGFPLGSRGVGAAVGSPAGAPPPRPCPPCATRDEPMRPRIATVHRRSGAPVIRLPERRSDVPANNVFMAVLTFHQPSAHWLGRA